MMYYDVPRRTMTHRDAPRRTTTHHGGCQPTAAGPARAARPRTRAPENIFRTYHPRGLSRSGSLLQELPGPQARPAHVPNGGGAPRRDPPKGGPPLCGRSPPRLPRGTLPAVSCAFLPLPRRVPGMLCPCGFFRLRVVPGAGGARAPRRVLGRRGAPPGRPSSGDLVGDR